MNILVVNIAFRYCLLEDGWVRGHPRQSIIVDQTPKLATGEQITADVIQPDGLTE
jgi:hypothetical protein